MQSMNRPQVAQPSPKRLWLTVAIFLSLIGTIIPFLPREYVLMVAVLLVGLPFAGLVVSRPTRITAVILLLAFVPLTSILKAVIGSRFAPLTFDLGLLLACALHLTESLLRHKLRLGMIDLLFGLFFTLAFLQMFNPNVPNLQAGIEGFRKFAFMSIAFYIGRHMLQTRHFSFLRVTLMIVSVPVALYGLKQFFFISAIDYRMVELATADISTYFMGGWLRPFSTLPGPFHLGLYLMVLAMLFIVRLGDKTQKLSRRSLITAVLVLQLIVLLMTRTKGNWGGFLVGLVILLILQTHSSWKLIVKIGGLTLLGGGIVTLILAFVSETASKVLTDAIFAITHPLQAPTFQFRLQLWQETVIPALLQHPWIGYGTSSAGEGLQNLYAGTPSLFFFSHNLFIKILLELGALGLVLFLIIASNSLYTGWKSLRSKDILPKANKEILQWSIAVVFSFLVAGIVIPTLDAYPANYYFWLLLGLLSQRFTKGTIHESTHDSLSRLEKV